ncbi:STAS domain-containing protein [[Mycobacterium] appelbergii]|uniref:STAS domain-containing protein n=1 Tax=[Mycobacterium] appelbergii TaxID=2939269 RepID=UPI0039774EEB
MSAVITLARPTAIGPVQTVGGRRASHAASFTTRWGRSGGLVTVRGEVDAANADQLVDHLQRAACYEWVVADLAMVEFMSTSGIVAMHLINARFADVDMRWAVVPGRVVSRLLDVCDPGTRLPIRKSLTVALASVQKLPAGR